MLVGIFYLEGAGAEMYIYTSLNLRSIRMSTCTVYILVQALVGT